MNVSQNFEEKLLLHEEILVRCLIENNTCYLCSELRVLIDLPNFISFSPLETYDPLTITAREMNRAATMSFILVVDSGRIPLNL